MASELAAAASRFFPTSTYNSHASGLFCRPHEAATGTPQFSANAGTGNKFRARGSVLSATELRFFAVGCANIAPLFLFRGK